MCRETAICTCSSERKRKRGKKKEKSTSRFVSLVPHEKSLGVKLSLLHCFHRLVARALDRFGLGVASALAIRAVKALDRKLLARPLPRVAVDLVARVGVGRAATCLGVVRDGLVRNVSGFGSCAHRRIGYTGYHFGGEQAKTYGRTVRDIEVASRAGDAPVVAVAVVACAAVVRVGEAK